MTKTNRPFRVKNLDIKKIVLTILEIFGLLLLTATAIDLLVKFIRVIMISL